MRTHLNESFILSVLLCLCIFRSQLQHCFQVLEIVVEQALLRARAARHRIFCRAGAGHCGWPPCRNTTLACTIRVMARSSLS